MSLAFPLLASLRTLRITPTTSVTSNVTVTSSPSVVIPTSPLSRFPETQWIVLRVENRQVYMPSLCGRCRQRNVQLTQLLFDLIQSSSHQSRHVPSGILVIPVCPQLHIWSRSSFCRHPARKAIRFCFRRGASHSTVCPHSASEFVPSISSPQNCMLGCSELRLNFSALFEHVLSS